MGLLQHAAAIPVGDTGYNITNSIKLETTNNEWLIRASPTAGNRRKHTFSFWIKRSTLGNPSASGTGYVIGQGQHGRLFFSSDFFQYRFDDGHDVRDVTTKHRDPSAWLHVVVAVDTNQSSSSNRVKIYFNGVQTTTIDLDGGSYPDQEDQASGWFTTNYLTIGTAPFGGSYNAGDGDYDMSGYLAEFVAIDGLQLAPTEFGEYDDDSGIWKAKDVSGLTFGDEGFHLNFSNASALGEDFSGNNNDFTLSNLAAADQSTDTPTNNFATINTLPLYNQGTFSFPNGATEIKRSDGGGDGFTCVFSTMAVNKGKWYAEMEVLESPSLTMYGYASVDYIQSLNFPQFYLGTANTESAGYYSNGDGANDAIYEANNFPSAGVQSSAGTIIGIAIDCDNNKIHFSNNGTYTNSSNPVNNTNGFPMPDDYVYFAQSSYTGAKTYKINLGGYTVDGISSAASDANGYGTFEYAPPSGYYALCTKNLAEYG